MRVLLLLLLVGCQTTSQPSPPPTGPLKIVTGFYPTAWITQRIAGSYAQVKIICPKEADPATWRPNAATITQIQAADLVILNGAGFEAWPQTTSLRHAAVVDTTRYLDHPFIYYAKSVAHTHGSAGSHAHTGLDGHTWLDPVNLLAQAKQVRVALSRARPSQTAVFKTNFAQLKRDLEQLEYRIRGLISTPHLASHPAYNYLARRFKWTLETLTLEPNIPLTSAQLDRLRTKKKATGAYVLLWESEPSAEVTQAVKQVGLTSVVFSPVEHRPDKGDYLSVMQSNLSALDQVFAPIFGPK